VTSITWTLNTLKSNKLWDWLWWGCQDASVIEKFSFSSILQISNRDSNIFINYIITWTIKWESSKRKSAVIYIVSTWCLCLASLLNIENDHMWLLWMKYKFAGMEIFRWIIEIDSYIPLIARIALFYTRTDHLKADDIITEIQRKYICQLLNYFYPSLN
jgi:hypothetical protein